MVGSGGLVLVRRVICAGKEGQWAMGKRRGLWAGVGGEAVGGFGDADGVDSGGSNFGIELIGELVGDVFGEVFGGGVEEGWGGKGRNLVEVVVGEGVADLFEGVFEEVEVAEEAFLIELGSGDGGGGFEVVAVGWFLGAVEDDGVGGAELVGDLD